MVGMVMGREPTAILTGRHGRPGALLHERVRVAVTPCPYILSVQTFAVRNLRRGTPVQIIRVAAVASSVVAATSADARTIELDLYGPGFVQLPVNDGLQALFPDEGFLLTGFSMEGPPFNSLYNLDAMNDGPTGLGEQIQQLTITRPPGRQFDLVSLDIDLSYSGWTASYTGLTNPSKSQRVVTSISPVFDYVELTGIKADGSTVESTFLPEDGVGFGPGFTDLVGLQFGAIGPGDADICRIENLVQIDPRFILSGLCSGTTFPNAPLTDIRTDLSFTGSTNDTVRYNLNSLTVRVDDAPAPIPLPASLPMLLAGLGGFVMLRRGWREPEDLHGSQ